MKLNFLDDTNENIKKTNEGIDVIEKFNLLLLRSSLITIYKSSIITHLDNGNKIYDQPNNSGFSDKSFSIAFHSIQRNATGIEFLYNITTQC